MNPRVRAALQIGVLLSVIAVLFLVFPAAFKAKHPEDYAKFVTAYRATLGDPEFRDWLRQNRMAGNWVGDERTTEIIRANFDALKKYKDLLRPRGITFD